MTTQIFPKPITQSTNTPKIVDKRKNIPVMNLLRNYKLEHPYDIRIQADSGFRNYELQGN